jgi:hypothetical protein
VAPTHAALQQLRSRIGERQNIFYKTVAQALGIVPEATKTSIQIEFVRRGSSKLKGLVIVDESSMLGESEVAALILLSTKVIFSGDNNQLSPVKKKSGFELISKMPQYELTKMMRAESSALMAAGFESLRRTQFVPETSIDRSVVCHDHEQELKATFLREVINHDPGECVWITRTNEEVSELNLLAHFCRTGRKSLAIGDQIRLYASSTLGKNNAVATIETLRLNTEGRYIINGVEAVLRSDYTEVTAKIEAIVNEFQEDRGSEFLASELELLRAIVPVDFPYAITTHKSQGASIKIVFANSQQLHGRRAFYVAYSRASAQLNVCKKIGKTKGVAPTGTTWKHKLGHVAQVADPLDVPAVRAKIAELVAPELVPSVSHLACVINPSHASKSAKGWALS